METFILATGTVELPAQVLVLFGSFTEEDVTDMEPPVEKSLPIITQPASTVILPVAINVP